MRGRTLVRRHAWLLLCLLPGLVSLSACESTAESGVVVGLDSSPNSLDPRFATSDASAKVGGLMFAGLTTIDTRTGDLELELAESIEQTSPTVYDIELRENAYFHDGTPVEARDVEYTLTELNSEKIQSVRAGISRRIDSFEIHSPTEFTITLNGAHAPFMTDMSLGIVPEHLCAGRETCDWELPIGAGPYRLVERKGDREFVLERHDKYFGDRPKPKRIIFRVYEDSNTRLLAALGGSIDVSQNTVSPVLLPVVENSDRLKIRSAPSFKYTYLAFNLRHSILSNQRVRKAVAYAIDREAIIDYKFRSYARKASGLLAPSHWAYNGDVPTYGYDPKKARSLLDEAGYPIGESGESRFEIEFKVSTNQFRRTVARLIARQLARVGIDVKVQAYEWGTLYADIKSGNFEITSMQWPSISEPDLYRYIFHSDNIPTEGNRTAGANRGAYKNQRVDNLLEKGRTTTDRKERIRIYGEIQRILAEQLPYVSLWHEDNIAVLQRGLGGYYMTPNGRFEGLRSVERPDTGDVR